MFGWETNQTAGTGTYALSAWLFLRLLGVIYFVAFISLAVQIKGLVGSHGILPVSEFLTRRRDWGVSRFWRIPTLCWFNSEDSFLLTLAWSGALLSLVLIAGFAPLPVLILLWLFYLSLFTVCRIFLGYQWDILLLETGFLGIFAAPLEIVPSFPPQTAPSPIVVFLLWWLLFRLMFSSGLVKLRSGDKTWRKLTALSHHYETQPLPTPLAWQAHQLPTTFHKVSALIMFTIELMAPFLIFAPPPARYGAAISFMVLMALIQLSGNYCFFNFLGLALSLLLFDDRVLLPLLGWALPTLSLPWHLEVGSPAINTAALTVAILIGGLSLTPTLRLFRIEIEWPGPLAAFFEFFERFRLVNSYGLFSVMTTERPEIIVEGSRDGTTWEAYEFKWKPGNVKRRPRFIAPHQPRLDWQMWFAALGFYANNPWFSAFLARLLEGSSSVLALLHRDPFSGNPPRYVRAVLYDYRFTNRAERDEAGAWWRREHRGTYAPVLELQPPEED